MLKEAQLFIELRNCLAGTCMGLVTAVGLCYI